jgi:hypothetical protein
MRIDYRHNVLEVISFSFFFFFLATAFPHLPLGHSAMAHTERTLTIPGIVLASAIHDFVANNGDTVRSLFLGLASLCTRLWRQFGYTRLWRQFGYTHVFVAG